MSKAGQETGLWGERAAERHLRKRGFRILGRRVRFGPREELDLVAARKDVLVFVEVKTRASEAFGAPVVAVDWRKRRHLSRAAVRYLQRLRRPSVYMRFDVVEVIGRADGGEPEVRHIENAFPLDSAYTLPG